MKRVLVTGATGFIGTATLQLLVEKGYEVHAVSSKKKEICDSNICWHESDLLDPTQVNRVFRDCKPSHLLHFAWYVDPKDYTSSDKNLKWLQSSIDLIMKFGEYGGKRTVIAGTCFEYDLNYGFLQEDITPIQPNSLYGICKAALNNVLKIYVASNDLSLAWGRIFYVYGKNENPNRVIPYVINRLLRGEEAFCSHGDQLRDFLNVHDVADAFVALLESDYEGSINISSGIPVKLKDIFLTIGKKIGREELVHLGKRSTSPQEPSIILGDIRKLREVIKWNPKYDLDKGLDEVINWWKKVGDI